MSNYKIDKGIPIPRKERKSESSYTKWPFRDMEPGDSFLVPNYSRERMSNVANAGRAYFNQTSLERKIVCRKVEGGFRVWVTKKTG